jgi:hypothetical protein
MVDVVSMTMKAPLEHGYLLFGSDALTSVTSTSVHFGTNLEK